MNNVTSILPRFCQTMFVISALFVMILTGSDAWQYLNCNLGVKVKQVLRTTSQLIASNTHRKAHSISTSLCLKTSSNENDKSDDEEDMEFEDEYDNANKFKTISPDEINKLFGSTVTEDYDEEDDEDYMVDALLEEEDKEAVDNVLKLEECRDDDCDTLDAEDNLKNLDGVGVSINLGTVSEADESEAEELEKIVKDQVILDDMKELILLEAKVQSSESVVEDESNSNLDIAESVSSSVTVKRAKNDSKDLYIDLNEKLEGKTRRTVKDLMTLKELSPERVRVGKRVFSYDPTEITRADPMMYGAYRRWKVPEQEATGVAATKVAKRGKSKKKDKKGKGIDTNSFYDAIRNLDKGTDSSGAGSTTFGEPKNNKPPITPKKAPFKKKRRKVITPDDIDSLFSNQNNGGNNNGNDDNKKVNYDDNNNKGTNNGNNEEDYDDKDDEDDEDDQKYDNGERVGGGGDVARSEMYNPVLGADEEVPKWLSDAETERKKWKMSRRRKKKKLTDKWQFWAVVIGGVGFLSAFLNMYQQTGGFGSNSIDYTPPIVGPASGAGDGAAGVPAAGGEVVI